jgi:GT2 family glycosyltransferase
LTHVGIVVVHLDALDTSRRCLQSVAALDHEDRTLVLVDNGSTDGSGDVLAAEFDVELVRAGKNLGFAGGANLGLRRALATGADYAWLLNNDARPRAAALTALVAAAESDARIGVVGSVLHEPDGIVWGGGTLSPLARTRPARSAAELDYVAGTSMLVRRGLLEDVGLLDEAFFFYYEDVDLCLRARARGWRLAVAPDSQVEHDGGATVARQSPKSDALQAESGGMLLRRRAGVFAAPLAVARAGGIAAQRVARRQPGRALPVARAFLRGVARGQRGVQPRA